MKVDTLPLAMRRRLDYMLEPHGPLMRVPARTAALVRRSYRLMRRSGVTADDARTVVLDLTAAGALGDMLARYGGAR